MKIKGIDKATNKRKAELGNPAREGTINPRREIKV